MNVNKSDKEILLQALDTELARLKRAVNAEKNLPIKEILQGRIGEVMAVLGRVSQEPAK